MPWSTVAALFFGGAFLANVVPRFVAGVSGTPFFSPFATPPFRGLSPPVLNVVYGLFNLTVAYRLEGQRRTSRDDRLVDVRRECDHDGHMQCSVAAAKAKLSELIRAAQDHKEVIITDRGRPVARLVPYEREEETLDDRFESFRQRGLLAAATGSTKDAWPAPTVVPGALARFLAERDSP